MPERFPRPRKRPHHLDPKSVRLFIDGQEIPVRLENSEGRLVTNLKLPSLDSPAASMPEPERSSRIRPHWDPWYASVRWLKRAKYQLRLEPFCRLCKARNQVTPAEVADHVVPHYGDPALFWFGELQSLCKPCHDGEKRLYETRGYSDRIGVDGYPIDPNHPFYRGSPP